MTAVKSRKKSSPPVRRKRSANGNAGKIVICVLIAFSIVLGLCAYIYFSDGKTFKNFSPENKRKNDGALIRDDENIYRNFQKEKLRNNEGIVNHPRVKKGVVSEGKEKINAPEYGAKDKDYLNNLIHSR